MVKTILVTILIIMAIIFIYPLECSMSLLGTSLFMADYSPNKNLIKGFGKVKIENYEKYEESGDEPYGTCKAIYFNEEQANKIEIQISEDERWTNELFKDEIINDYKKFNIIDLGKSYYYLIEIDRDGIIIEMNREVLDNKKIEWYKSAIYDSDNKTLYYYYRHYEK